MYWRTISVCISCLLLFGCGGGDDNPGTPPTIHEVGVYREVAEPIDINVHVEVINVNQPSSEKFDKQIKEGLLQYNDKKYESLHTVGPESNTSRIRISYNRGEENTMHGFYIAIRASDPELDMHNLYVNQYRDGSETPVYVDTIELPEQQTSNWLYWNVFYLFGHPGEWRTSFMIQDETGRNSNVYWLHTSFIRR